MYTLLYLDEQHSVAAATWVSENIPGRPTYLHDQLVGSGDQSQAVGVVEGLRYVLAKGVPGPSGRDSPTTAVVRV